MEGSVAVIPECVRLTLECPRRDFRQADRLYVRERGTFGGSHVGGLGEQRDVPDVLIARCHVEVTGQGVRQVRIRCQLGLSGRLQRSQPAKLVGVVLVVGLSSVRYVQAPHTHATARGTDRAGFDHVLVRGLVGEVEDHIAESYPGKNCHPVPTAVPVRSHFVPQRLDRHLGKGFGGAFQLLECDHIGLSGFQPLDYPLNASSNRVDVPRRNPHTRTLGNGPYPGCRGERTTVTLLWLSGKPTARK